MKPFLVTVLKVLFSKKTNKNKIKSAVAAASQINFLWME